MGTATYLFPGGKMSYSRASMRSTIVMAIAVIGVLLSGTVAQAKPPSRPGAVKNLAAVVTKPAGAYSVAVTWSASTNTTSYALRLTNSSGVVLDSERVTATSWTGLGVAAAGSSVTISITPYNGTRKGPQTSISKTLPDITAPQGSFTVSSTALTGTLTQTSLSDDLSPADAITRTVDWGDGSGLASWSTGSVLQHSYPAQGRYLPSVTLVDLAGNAVTIQVNAMVILDTQAPTGTFSTTPASAWMSYTKVAVTQLGLADDLSPAPQITRSVEWGDGNVTPWTSGTTLSHVYTVAGSYSPTVVLVDEAGNTGHVVASGVTVTQDSLAPALRLRVPATKKAYVASWKVIKGTATDTGTGVKQVRLKAIEKRGATYYSYKAATKRWVKAGTTKSAAWRKATFVIAVPAATGAWKANLKGLKLGTLSISVTARDKVNNTSPARTKSQKLTHA
ncbi:exported hypothetical protein [metagenome]|uniref:PKD domain-containing protein n=1 Tax=metagenome TaxID=256318 RepID=A0A2P2BZL1_9ZZZZ